MSGPGRRQGEARHDVVQAIARQLLVERLDELTSRALEQLEAEEAAYASAGRDPVQKREGMRRTLELALTRLAGGPVPGTVSRATEDVGRERAEQACPLTALMHSFQLDLRTLWEAVLAEGRAHGISADPDFLGRRRLSPHGARPGRPSHGGTSASLKFSRRQFEAQGALRAARQASW
ncbi:hypothetical protein ACFYZ2_29565 [Streptomyces sviceus]|uniref:hypothetical protein n=1 Tax=Streptomyces sviceus TaxID=285530 RepID=UPI0036C64023